MEYVKSFKDLEVYKLSRELARNIYTYSKNFPVEEKYSLTDQIRRSSRSIGAQIAEAWGKRNYERHFISKLTDRTPNTEHRTPNTEHRIPNTEYRIPDTEYRTPKGINISRAINELSGKGIIFSDKSGYVLSDPLLERFIKERVLKY